jgi:hypothetical protein
MELKLGANMLPAERKGQVMTRVITTPECFSSSVLTIYQSIEHLLS